MNVKLLIPILWIGTCLGEDQAKKALINSIFTKNYIKPTAIRDANGRCSSTQCGNGKECVPKYLCDNGKIIKDASPVFDIRFDDDTCGVLETCCAVGNIVKEPWVKLEETKTGCGFRNIEGVGFRIEGDVNNEAQFGEFPWMVAIMYKTNFRNNDSVTYLCGGSLITPQVVLTAAHCVIKPNIRYAAKSLKVRAGEWETNTKNEVYPDQDSEVVEIIAHENFNKRQLYNDIALLVVDPPLELAPNVNTVCLPPAGFNFDLARCFATGWGKDKFQNGKYQNILKKIELPVVPNAKCQENLRKTRLGKYFELHSSFMCAGGERGKDMCTGDGGSPLVCPLISEPNRFFQAGIVAWGIGCGDENVPGVYGTVPQFRSWIDEKLANKMIASTFFTP